MTTKKEVYEKPRPKSLGKSKALSPNQKLETVLRCIT
jgi:hypothetical protein